MFVLVALGWGLFWSSILKSCAHLRGGGDRLYRIDADVPHRDVSGCTQPPTLGPDRSHRNRGDCRHWRVGRCLGCIFHCRRAVRRLNLEFRSPIVVTRSQSSSRNPVTFQPPSSRFRPYHPGRWPWRTCLKHRGTAFNSVVVDGRGADAWHGRRSRKESIAGFCSQRLRSFLPCWHSCSNPTSMSRRWRLAGVLVALVAGASALGLENRASTRRFLVHHGARPGLVWLVKISVWVAGVAVIGVLAAGGPLRKRLSARHAWSVS